MVSLYIKIYALHILHFVSYVNGVGFDTTFLSCVTYGKYDIVNVHQKYSSQTYTI